MDESSITKIGWYETIISSFSVSFFFSPSLFFRKGERVMVLDGLKSNRNLSGRIPLAIFFFFESSILFYFYEYLFLFYIHVYGYVYDDDLDWWGREVEFLAWLFWYGRRGEGGRRGSGMIGLDWMWWLFWREDVGLDAGVGMVHGGYVLVMNESTYLSIY